MGDALRSGVDFGYRVIDEYLRQGMSTARAFSGRAGEDPTPAGSAGPAPDLLGQMIRMSTEFSSAWLSMLMGGMAPGTTGPGGLGLGAMGLGPMGLGAMGLGGLGSAPAPPPPDRAPAGTPAPRTTARTSGDAAQPEPAGPHVAVDVRSSRPVEVTLDLRTHAPGALLVHDLRASDPELPRLRDVALVQGDADQPLALRIRVPDDQPAGVYSGVIVEAQTSLPRGTVCVRIRDEH